MEFGDRRVIVTGGTSGIGLAAARLFLDAGAEVIVSGRDAARGAAAVDELSTADGRRVRFESCDLGDLTSVERLAAAVGPVDVLVNNAAHFPLIATLDESPETYERTFNVNVRGAFFLTAALLPAMIEHGGGNIVNVTSLGAVKGVPRFAVYCATKAALESLTRTWAVEFAPHGIRVNTVAPATTVTPGFLAEWGDQAAELGKNFPLGRPAQPEEVAHAILFVASPHASFVTGSTLAVDGGGGVMTAV
jgi:NAD(P)-dependent dehydrogenase (short-subunit alcohol dehydrogenase family)